MYYITYLHMYYIRVNLPICIYMSLIYSFGLAWLPGKPAWKVAAKKVTTREKNQHLLKQKHQARGEQARTEESTVPKAPTTSRSRV